MPMHILILPSWYSTADKPWRGTFVRDQARALAKAGAQVGLAFVERRSLSGMNLLKLISSHFQTVSAEEDGVSTLRMKGWSTFAQTVPGARTWALLTRNLVKSYASRYGVPDVIHGHAALWGGHAAMLCARELGRPYIVTEHSSSVLTLKLSAKERQHAAAVYNNASAVVAVSRPLARAVDQVAGGRTAVVIPNTVDSDYFHMPARPRAARPFTFLAVADLVRYKRLDLVLSAFARLRVRNPGVRLVIAGAGKDARALQTYAELLDIGRDVMFAGPLPRWHVRQLMWDANALVLPSEHETFGVVLIEAMSTGLPVIATRCGGPEEVVTREAGILVDRNDADALLRAMETTMSRRVDETRIHDSVRRRYGYDAVAHRLWSVYEHVAPGRREVA